MKKIVLGIYLPIFLSLSLLLMIGAGSVWAAPVTIVSGIPGPATTIYSEQVGGTDAHVVQLTTPGTNPNYKWQFLTGGVRLFIDRKDAFGWVQLISQIQTAPEYMKQQGAPGNFVWNSYGLNINTSGSNVLQGFDKQAQPDGSTKLVRTYSTTEEGVPETLTETWTIPASAGDLGSKGPKVTFSMTKNRGIILTKGVNEGTWRMRWALSGIADIVADSADIKDSDNWPIRTKSYSNNEFKIDVNDFDNAQNNINSFSFSETAANNKAEILFFKNGTIGDRIIDPTIVTSGVDQPWWSNTIRNVFYNGTNFFVFYDKLSSSIFACVASTIAGLSNGAGGCSNEQTVVNAEKLADNTWDVYLVNDSKFDIAYNTDDTSFKIRTCNIDGTTISCNNASSAIAQSGTTGDENIHVVRTPTGDRIWIMEEDGVFSANQTGDSEGITTMTAEANLGDGNYPYVIVPYNSSDKIVVVGTINKGGTASDGFWYVTCLQSDASCSTYTKWLAQDNPGVNNAGNLIRVSDTDFRFVYINATSDTIEAKFDGSSTWTTAHATVHTGTDKRPAMFYDRVTNQSFVLYADSNDDIWYHQKTCTSNSGCSESAWGNQTNADNDEADANFFPVTQMHEPPLGSSRTAPLEFTWCYMNDATIVYDVVCDNLNLAAAPTPTPAPVSGTSNFQFNGLQMQGIKLN